MTQQSEGGAGRLAATTERNRHASFTYNAPLRLLSHMSNGGGARGGAGSSAEAAQLEMSALLLRLPHLWWMMSRTTPRKKQTEPTVM